MVIKCEEKGMNEIWLCDANDSNIIKKAEVIVTDKNKFDILSKDIESSACIYTGYGSGTGFLREHTRYTLDGYEKIHEAELQDQYDGRGYRTGSDWKYFIQYYTNPRAIAYQLITGNLKSYSLIRLFNKIDVSKSYNKRIECGNLNDYKIVNTLIESLSYEELREVLNKLWPNFSCYAFEGLNCTDIEIVKTYNIEELKDIVKKNNSYLLNGERFILKNTDIAKTNHKILSLARKVNSMSKS